MRSLTSYALFGPRLVALQDPGGHEFEDRRLHGVERGKHPGDGARPRIGIVRQQARMVLGDVEDDRACLEQGKVAFLIGRNQAEGTNAQMRGLVLRFQKTILWGSAIRRGRTWRIRLSHSLTPGPERLAAIRTACIGVG